LVLYLPYQHHSHLLKITRMNMINVLSAMTVVAGLAGTGYFLEDRYANKEELIQLVGSNAQQIALTKIEIAKQSGNKALLNRLCTDFQQTHRWVPSACK